MTAVRPAVPADIPAIAAILAANDEPIDWPDVAGWPYVDHLLARARVAVAESDGAVAGFAGAIDVGDARFLTDLFVDPARQEHGIGRALLDAAMDGAAARMTNSSADPRALGLYIRAGMRPWWPLLYLVGEVASLGRPPEGIDWSPGLDRGDGPLVAYVDRCRSDSRLRGTTRACRTPPGSSSLTAVRSQRSAGRGGLGGKPVGRSTTSSIAPDADPVRAALGAWHAAAPRGERLMGCVPGPHPVVPVLLDAKIRIADRDHVVRQRPGSRRSRSVVAEPELPLVSARSPGRLCS